MSKSVNVDFVTRQIEVDTDGKEYYVSAAVAAKDAEQSMLSAQNAATSVKKYKALWFDSVASMKAEPSLTAGAYVCTSGYYAPNDGGGASYLIRSKTDGDTDDGGSIHELKNGLVAELIIENGTVNVKQFGSKGDGVTNDHKEFKGCVDYANEKLVDVIVPSGDYYISGEAIDVYVSMYWQNSTVYLDEFQNLNPLFYIKHDNADYKNEINTVLSSVFTNAHTLTDEYRNKFMQIATEKCYGKRFGTSDEKYYLTYAIQAHEEFSDIDVDYDGLSTETVTLKYLSDVNERVVVFSGCNVRNKTLLTKVPQLLQIERNNTIAENISVKLNYDQSKATTSGYVVNIQGCCNVRVSNYNGFANEKDVQWSYLLSAYSVSNMLVEKSNVVNGWHSFGGNTITNFTARDCTTYFECHVNMFGNWVFENCNWLAGAFYLAAGNGTITFRNCSFKYDYAVTSRNDYASRYSGTIIFEHCNIRGRGVRTQVLTTNILNDTTRSSYFATIKYPDVKFYDCTIGGVGYLVDKTTYENVVYGTARFEGCTVGGTGVFDNATYMYVFKTQIYINCNVTLNDFVENAKFINCYVNLRNDTRDTTVSTTASFYNCYIYWGRAAAIRTSNFKFVNCHIESSFGGGIKTNCSYVYINCTGHLLIECKAVYVIGGSFSEIKASNVETEYGQIHNAVINSNNFINTMKGKNTFLFHNVLTPANDAAILGVIIPSASEVAMPSFIEADKLA